MGDINIVRELSGIKRYIYYYTSLESLTGIFPLNDSQTINMFATHFKFLNDKEEIILGKKLIRDIQKTAGKIVKPLNPFKDPYILSFSQSPDNLPMWGMYGNNGGGVMLTLDANKIIENHPFLFKCFYYDNVENKFDEEINNFKSNYQKFVDNFKKGLTQSNDLTNWKIRFEGLPYLIKGDFFKYEKEIRIVEDNIQFSGDMVCHRFGKNGYTPYIVKKFPKEVLSSVMIGPISNSRKVVEKVKMHLTKFGYDNVIVNTSRIPYR